VLLATFCALGAGFACGGGNNETTAPPNASASAAASSPANLTSVSATASAPAPTLTPIAVVAMQLTGGTLKKPVELAADGSVIADGKAAAKFVGAELQDTSGKTLIAVAADDTVRIDGVTATMKFDLKDELFLENGNRIAIADDGAVILTTADRKPDKDSRKMKFLGFNRTAVRAAVLIVVALATSKLPAKK
jgi:hypothetical protein